MRLLVVEDGRRCQVAGHACRRMKMDLDLQGGIPSQQSAPKNEHSQTRNSRLCLPRSPLLKLLFVPSYKQPSSLTHFSYHPQVLSSLTSWRITPLSSLSVCSLTALLPPPPRKPTCSTSSASRPFRLNRFLNPLWSSMLPRPPTLLPSSPTPSTPAPPSRKRAQSFAHSFRSTSLQTKT